MKKVRKIVAIALIMVMMNTSPVRAQELNADNGTMGTREVNLYSSNNRHFAGSYSRYVNEAGYITTYLDAVMNIYYYYEEGVYAEIVEYAYSSSSATHNGSPTTCNYYYDTTHIHDGSICATFGINGVVYRCRLTLDEWGDSSISRFGLFGDFD